MNRIWSSYFGIVNLIAVLLVSFCAYSQQYYTVVANSGVNLRSGPGIDSKIIDKVAFGTWLKGNEAMEEIFDKEAELIGGRKGVWIKVRYGQKEAYAFSGNLLRNKWHLGNLHKDTNQYYDEYDIYNDRKLPETINTIYKLIIPGFKDYKNFNPNIEWHAIIKKQGEFYVEKTNLEMIPGYEYFTFLDENIWNPLEGPYIYTFECKFGSDVLFYIGSLSPLNTGKISSCIHDMTELPKLLYPEERISFRMEGAKDAWIYAFEENYVDYENRSHQQLYQLKIFSNYYGTEEISDLLEYSLFRYPAKQHIYKKATTIDFIGDLNEDGICDFILYFTDGKESCGMQYEYQLFMSDAETGTFYLASNSPRGY
jgi:hypothetical protein